MKHEILDAISRNIMKYIDPKPLLEDDRHVKLVIFRTMRDYFAASVLTKADHHNLCGETHRRDSDK